MSKKFEARGSDLWLLEEGYVDQYQIRIHLGGCTERLARQIAAALNAVDDLDLTTDLLRLLNYENGRPIGYPSEASVKRFLVSRATPETGDP